MAESKKETERSTEIVREPAKSLAIAEAGIRTDRDFSACFSALIADLLSGRVGHSAGNAVCNAGGKLLKNVELAHRYGAPVGDGSKLLSLAR